MKLRQMALAAAIMALQATALYLLSTSSGQARMVYRCGNSYQMHPCADASIQPMDQTTGMRDARTLDQVLQAQAFVRQQQRQLHGADKAHRALARRRARHPGAAVALSCHRSGQRPFTTCDDRLSGQVSIAREATTTVTLRPQRPFIARIPKTQVAGASRFSP